MENGDQNWVEVPQPNPNAKHYVDNERLNANLAAWIEACKEQESKGLKAPMMPKSIAADIMSIGHGVSCMPRFVGYSYKDDMVSEGILVCCSYIRNYNPNAKTRSGAPNAFSYITRIMYTSFINFISDEEEQDYYKGKSLEMLGLSDSDLAEIQTPNSQIADGVDIISDILGKVHKFEEKRKMRLARNRRRLKDKEVPTTFNLLDIMEGE